MSDFEARAHAALAELEKRQKPRLRWGNPVGRGRLRSFLIVAAPFCAIIALTTVTGAFGDNDPAGVVTAARTWAAERPEAYELTYTRHDGEVGTMGPATVRVEGDTVVEYRTEDRLLEDATVLTVDAMLLLVESVARDADAVEVAYDPDDGHPISARITGGGIVSGTWGFDVVAFRPLTP